MTSERWKRGGSMDKIDMSAKAVTARLKRVAQLRRLGLSLQQAKLKDGKIGEHPASKNPSTSETHKRQ
jgi:hypothetical protein